MKINHTPFGVLSSNKKLVAGAVALALVSGITPAVISKTHALEAPVPVSSIEETLYTTVGPEYFTITDLYVSDYSDYNIRVADTSVAEVYDGSSSPSPISGKVELESSKFVSNDAMSVDAGNMLLRGASTKKSFDNYFPVYAYACEEYICLQGNKVGTTELILEGNGETLRYPVTSVELTPEANLIEISGKEIKGEGSIVGADNNLLRLRNVLTREGTSGMQTGERSYSLYSNSEASGAYLVWTIGNQRVGGGTEFNFYPLSGIDYISGDKDNEAILEDVFKTFMKDMRASIHHVPDLYRYGRQTLSDGTIITYDRTQGDFFNEEPSSVRVVLGSDDARITESAKKQFVSKLPENIVDTNFEQLNVNIVYCFEDGGDIKDADGRVFALGGEDEFCVTPFNIEKLGNRVLVSYDVSDVPEVKSGYARKWYVVRDNNGTIESVEAEYDEKAKTLNFYTILSGYVAYGYVDELIPVEDVPSVPNTGIAPAKVATTAAATILPVLTIAGVAFMVRSKKKADNKLAKKHNHFE